MSYGRTEENGKDVIVFLTQQDEPSSPSPAREEPAESTQAEAYNEETGEINWDCPCLGGMVKPPCGDRFKEAFSCFVHSKEEPKGADCVEQFRAMQECFKEHPDIYGAELDDELDQEEDDKDDDSKELPESVK